MKYHGSLEGLKIHIQECGFSVVRVEDIEHGHHIVTAEGALVNWYPSTGSVSIQGKTEAKQRLEGAWSQHDGGTTTTDANAGLIVAGVSNKKIFVVHGHDGTSLGQLELILYKLGLNPFVLANTSGGGLTIIEALDKEIGPREGQVRFGIVLLTPDDIGFAKEDGPDKAEPRARQNVVMEMGMLIAAIGRSNVAILKRGHLEVPSNAQGILYIPFNDHVKETVPKLVDRLRISGFVLSPQEITNAST